MPSAKTLLERIENPEADDRQLTPRLSDLVDSVCRHLSQLLNSCHDGSETAPDYGISSLSEFFRGQLSVEQIQQEIRTSITKYEPRLRRVDVNFVANADSPFEIRFDIVGTVVGDGGERPAVFRSVLEASGRLRVTEG